MEIAHDDHSRTRRSRFRSARHIRPFASRAGRPSPLRHGRASPCLADLRTMVPVPITMQTFALTMIGVLYGWRGRADRACWLGEAMMGLPVLANGGGGLHPLSARPPATSSPSRSSRLLPAISPKRAGRAATWSRASSPTSPPTSLPRHRRRLACLSDRCRKGLGSRRYTLHPRCRAEIRTRRRSADGAGPPQPHSRSTSERLTTD